VRASGRTIIGLAAASGSHEKELGRWLRRAAPVRLSGRQRVRISTVASLVGYLGPLFEEPGA
jgi:hypothetical protein